MRGYLGCPAWVTCRGTRSSGWKVGENSLKIRRNVDHQLLPVIHGVYKRSQDKGEGPKISRQHKALRESRNRSTMRQLHQAERI
jgi:hypothetical protein